MKPETIIENLNFRALETKMYRIAIFLIVLAILIPAAVFMIIVIYYDIKNLGRGQIVSIMGLAGFASFFLVAFIFSKFLAKNYVMAFYPEKLTVQFELKEQQFELNRIRKFEVWNNSDYSKLVLYYDDEEIKYHVGFANLLNVKPILQDENILDVVFTEKKGFIKQVNNVKGYSKICYIKA